jgi:hypothetical protein
MKTIVCCLSILLASCGTARRHAAQRVADAVAYTQLAADAIAVGDLAAAATHLQSSQIQHGAALYALGFQYDPAADPEVAVAGEE